MSKTTLKPIVAKLREAIIKGIAGKLEKYGFDDRGKIIVEKPLSEYDQTVKESIQALFEAKGINNLEHYIEFIHNSSRTFLHILICFKLMEKRGIMSDLLVKIIGTNIYTEIIPDFIVVNSIAYEDFITKYEKEIEDLSNRDDNEEDIEYYRFIFLIDLLAKEMAKIVPLLFKEYEYNLVHPDYDDMKIIMRIIFSISDDEYQEDDFLGWIYQYWVDTEDYEIEESESNKDISFANLMFYKVLKMLEKEQTEYGEFYTPRWVVKNIVDNAIRIYRENNDNAVENIRLLDPACGAGNFLVYSFDALLQEYNFEHPDWEAARKITSILENNIYGVDIQREPLQITALNLWIKAKTYAINTEVQKLNLFNLNVLMANSLFPWETEEEYKQITIWDTPETLANRKFTSEDIGRLVSSRKVWNKNTAIQLYSKKFDIVVMNPPFVDARKMNEEELDLLKTYYPENARNLFGAFIVRALNVLNKKGVLGFISSDSYFTISSFQKLRAKILKTTIKEVDLLGGGVFDGPAVSASLMFICNNTTKKNIITVFDRRNKTFENEVSKEVLQTVFEKISGNPFIFELSKGFIEILSEKTLGDYDSLFEIRKGIVTSGNNKYLRKVWEVPKEKIGKDFLLYNKDIESVTYPISCVLDCRKTAIDEMKNNASSRLAYLLDNYNFITGDNSFKTGVLFSLTGNLKACILKKELFDVSFPAILCKKEDDVYLILALMLSKFSKYCLGLLNSTMHTTPGDVRRLPIVFPNERLRVKIKVVVCKLITIKKKADSFNVISDDFIQSELEEYLKKNTTTLKDAIALYRDDVLDKEKYCRKLYVLLDELIYKLYGLDDEDISIVETATRDNCVDYFEVSEKMLVFKYIQNRIYQNIYGSKKLYTKENIIDIVRKDFEEQHIDGYKLYEEAFAILETDISSLILNQLKIGNKKVNLFDIGNGVDCNPWMKGRVLGGKGKTAEAIFWCSSDFMIDYNDDSKYVLQNEIRRLVNEVYSTKLQRLMEKKATNQWKLTNEKYLQIISDAVKTLENWKVVD